MKRIETGDLETLSHEAAASDRLRANRNLHDDLAEPVQRMLNAFEPGTYVRPHRHADPPKWELFLALKGAAACLTFDDAGTVTERCDITAGGPLFGVEIPAGTWHTLVALEPGTVLFELKEGPFQPLADKDFAAWAAAEGTGEAEALETWLHGARPGDSWSAG
jgi:cupin fold WbuC family metalloprotein